jgi:hypothetical protein
MLAGVLAALLATLFARVFAEPHIDLAIAFEAAHQAHHLGHAEPIELVSRATQQGIGLLTALALYGAAVGGIFSLVFAYGYGRLVRIGPRSFALALAMLAFVVLVVTPGIKYPQTPPAVGRHETVGLRTAAYFGMMFLSVAAAIIALKLGAVFARSVRGFDAALLAVGSYVLLTAVGQLLLPAVNEVPADFPATVLWDFRLAALASQLVLWATIGLAFGRWAARRLERARR